MSEPAKSKAQLKAERRALQEAQRDAKASGQKLPKANKSKATPPEMTNQNKENNKSKAEQQRTPEKEETSLEGVHAAFRELETHETAEGTDELAAKLVATLQTFVGEFKSGKGLKRELEAALDVQLNYLNSRPNQLHPALAKIISQLKIQISKLEESDEDKQILLEWLEDYASRELELAYKSIELNAIPKLRTAKRILTYSWSEIVERIIVAAAEEQELEVIVVDSVEQKRGLRLVDALAKAKRAIPLTYAPLNSIHSLMNQCDRVLMGAEAILADGSAVVEVGAAQVALLAKVHNVPLLMPAASYKYIEKVGTVGDWFSWDTELVSKDMVTAVVTEIRILPASAAPHVLRTISTLGS